MEEIKIWIAIFVSIVGMIISIYGSYLNTLKRREEKLKADEDRKREIQIAIEEVRKHADDSYMRTENNIKEIRAGIADMKMQIMEQRTKIELFWRCIEVNVGSLLKSFPTNIDKDLLLTKMIEQKLTLPEAEQLKEILIGEMEVKKQQDKSLIIAYVIAIAGLTRTIYDLERDEEVI